MTASGRTGDVEALTTLTLPQLRKIRRTVAARRERIGCSSDSEFVRQVRSFTTWDMVGISLPIRRLLHNGFCRPTQDELGSLGGRSSHPPEGCLQMSSRLLMHWTPKVGNLFFPTSLQKHQLPVIL